MKFLPSGLEDPALLPLLLAAFLPIILHIIDRRRARAVEWPSLRFLVSRSKSRLRRLRLREAALIAARSFAALSIAAAALGPFRDESGPPDAELARPREVVFIVDDSPSMAYRDAPEDRSPLERARDAVLDALDGLRSTDRAALLAPSTGVRRPLTAELDLVRRDVRDLRPGGAPFRLIASVDEAAEWIEGASPGTTREIHVFSDLQRSVARPEDVDTAAFLRGRLEAAGEVRSSLVDCGARAPLNRFVERLEKDPLAAGTDEPSILRAEIEVSGSPGRRNGSAKVQATLSADGEELASVEIDATPAGPARADFSVRLRRPGLVRVEARLPADGLPEDDARRTVLEVRETIRVLLLGSETRLPALAFAPTAPGLDRPRVIFRTEERVRPKAEDPAGFDLVVIAAPPVFSEAECARIEAFVQGGGGLIIFAEPGVDSVLLSEALWRGGRGILPARLDREAASSALAVHPTAVDFAHPAMAIFARPGEGDLSRIDVWRWATVGALAPGSKVLARLGGGFPWIVEGSHGEGRAILLTTSAAPRDSSLPVTTLFLPLLHALGRYASAGSATTREWTLGEEISLEPPEGFQGDSIELTLPDSTARTIEIPEGSRGGKVNLGTALRPGFVVARFLPPPGGTEPPAAILPVNVAPEESRLEKLDAELLARLRSVLGLELGTSSPPSPGGGAARESRQDLRGWALALALLFILLEAALARGFTQAPGRLRSPAAVAPLERAEPPSGSRNGS